MVPMSLVSDAIGGLAGGRRRVVAARYGPAAAGLLLGCFAVGTAMADNAFRYRLSVSPGRGFLLLILALASLLATLPLAIAWAHPAPAAVVITAANLLSVGGFRTFTVAGLIALLAALYRLGHSGSQLLAGAMAVPFLVIALINPWRAEPRVFVVLAASLGMGAALAGAARRSRTEAVRHSAAREEIAGTLLEHTARGERARISRELHDVVAHHISMIAVQAETARLATPGMPAAGAQRLSAIGDTARAALTEMRRLLGVLREDTETVTADRRPQPGLRQLNELLDEARDAAGTAARLIVSGRLTALDPGVELATYRIVQEALTNARRHAPGAAVDVELHYATGELTLRIRDNGPGPPAQQAPGVPESGHGHGLLGMRERAAAVGGELRTGPAPGGGFLVEAWLPARTDSAE
jgi:signal transduction histidine kinase